MVSRVGSVVLVAVVAVPAATALAARCATFAEVERTVDLVLVLHQHAVADLLARLEVAAAMEVGRVVGAAAAVVDRGLRVRTQRARARDHAARGDGGADGLGRLLLLDPVDQRVEQALRLRARAATAVADPRSAEQAIELLHAAEIVVVRAAVALG